FRNSALLKTRTYLGLLTPCLALHGSQRKNYPPNMARIVNNQNAKIKHVF
ncbi:hypothetical protein K661_01562, partial [Piscirickettsia salmonis LF-89 = ATCC VR-1361]